MLVLPKIEGYVLEENIEANGRSMCSISAPNNTVKANLILENNSLFIEYMNKGVCIESYKAENLKTQEDVDKNVQTTLETYKILANNLGEIIEQPKLESVLKDYSDTLKSMAEKLKQINNENFESAPTVANIANEALALAYDMRDLIAE